MAAKENEAAVDCALRERLERGLPISVESIEEEVLAGCRPVAVTDIVIAAVALSAYDRLLGYAEARA